MVMITSTDSRSDNCGKPTLRFLDSNHGPSLFWFSYDKGKSWQGPFKFPQFGNGVLARTDYLVEGPHHGNPGNRMPRSP